MKLKLAESENELNQILDLQNENHYKNVSNKLKKTDGFVTVRHNMGLLTEMNNRAKQVIAIENGKVIGYALAMLKDYKSLIPELIPMFNVFESIKYENSKLNELNYYLMGQICIAKKYRGKGIFQALSIPFSQMPL